MDCSLCESPVVVFSIPSDYRGFVPEKTSLVGVCTHCLTLEPAGTNEAASEGDRSEPDFSRISDAFPTAPEQAIPLALAIDRCSSLATNRAAIESLLHAVERAGADPLLAIDRLCADPTVEPIIDLERRAHQLEQLLY
ncbi:DUF6276 family protein [Natrialbaceae archaeon A-arb3/5]